jgi:LysR family transcriptional regulator, glycine cleavage system transcriptional activator
MTLRPDWLPALAAFEAAARHQNFAHAAEELHVTASAVSHHVRKLEARLGIALFQRHARGVVLTPEGRQLADAAGNALSDVEGVLRDLRSGQGNRELVRVATLHSLTTAWLLPRLPEFFDRHPRVRIAIDTEIALTRFDDSGPDLAIRHGPGQWPGHSAHLLMGDALFPVASPSLPGASDARNAAAVSRLPLVSDLARQGWQDWFRAAGVHGATPDIRCTFTDSTDALEAAAHSLGVALAREKIAAPWLDSGRLLRMPGPQLATRWSYYAVYPSHRRPHRAAQAFIDWLLEVSAEERASPASHKG